MSYRREITTLGRGGSDTTAVALAAALGAERCEIYSDVDGVYTADPRSVAAARHLPEIDCATMQEMAEAGAKVLNARAVEWAEKCGIVIAARRTSDFAHESGGRETRVVAATHGRAPWTVVGDQKLALLASPRAGHAVLAAAAEAALPLRDVTLEGEALSATVSLLNAPDLARFRTLAAAAPFVLETDMGQVSLVGVGVADEPGLFGRALALLPDAPRRLFASPLRVSAILPAAAVPAAERAWHAAFVAAAESL